MAITPPYNDIEMTTAWAEDAATTIPSVPVPGISYRNTGISEETIANGQAYDNIGRSADWNQLLYKISANIVTMQKQGASLLWISGRNYEQGSLVKDPDNAQIYYRLKAGAGTTKPASDKTNWQLLQDYFRGQGLTLNGNKIHWGVAAVTSGDLNNIIQPGIYRLGPGSTNLPTDIEGDASGYYGFMMVFSSSYNDNGVVSQIAYQEANKFSMNVRFKDNANTWSAWTRFGVEFTLDWRSGGDYRAGDLVRDTSNSLLYVCTTAINNSTQRPGLDTGHFQLLQSYVAGEGLEVRNNKITWGVSGGYLQNIDVATIIKAGTYRIGTTGVTNAAFAGNHSMIVIKFATTQVLQLAFISLTSNGPVAVRGITDIDGTPEVGVWNYSSAFDSLDFISGRTYDIGQLVRGSNNIHYVKKTASSVCTTEPNSDSTNFETLAQNIIDQGLLVIGNKINWGNCNAVASPDANELVDPGVYYVDTPAENIPIANRGFIVVVKSSNNSNATTMQYYFSCSTAGTNHNLYIRTYTPTTDWSAWTKIGPAEEVSASDLAGNGLTAANNKLNWGTNANNITNFNNAQTPGVYTFNTDSTNAPATTGGTCYITSSAAGNVTQFAFDSGNGTMYTRYLSSGTWSNWVTVTNGIGANMSTGKQNRSFGTTYTAATDGFVELTAYSNWRANTNGQLYINNNEIAVNHTGQYGSGGQSSGVQTTIYVRAGDQYRCNQGSLEYYWWFPNN